MLPEQLSLPLILGHMMKKKKAVIKSHIPMKEVGTGEQIAKAILFLASKESEYITGQSLFVDGGLTLFADFGEDWSSS